MVGAAPAAAGATATPELLGAAEVVAVAEPPSAPAATGEGSCGKTSITSPGPPSTLEAAARDSIWRRFRASLAPLRSTQSTNAMSRSCLTAAERARARAGGGQGVRMSGRDRRG
jgi:hypothetical protein